MNVNSNLIFFDMNGFDETIGIKERTDRKYIETELKKRLPKRSFAVMDAYTVENGAFFQKENSIKRALPFLSKTKGLPPYSFVKIRIFTGEHFEELFVLSPFKWNKRFLATCGGGTCTGGRKYFNKPTNKSRGQGPLFGLLNGFSTATIDAENVDGFLDRMVKDDGEIDTEYYENWRDRATHDMAVFSKEVIEILHEEKIVYSYLNGGSGGGRQSVTSALFHPTDFDGIWASCPAINWSRFLPMGLYFPIVFEKYSNTLTPKKLAFISKKARESVGSEEKYYETVERIDFDARTLIGCDTKDGKITENDALCANEIWAGPKDKDGSLIYPSFRPGGIFWMVGIPIGAFYFTLPQKKVKPFFLSDIYVRWVKGDKNWKNNGVSYDEFCSIMKESAEKFSDVANQDPDLTEFSKHGKLMIDHGTDDPLIPVEGTIDFYKKIIKNFGEEKTNEFLRLFVMPGDSHGNLNGKGGGMTAREGFRALLDWVENGKPPKEVTQTRINKKGEITSTRKQEMFKLN